MPSTRLTPPRRRAGKARTALLSLLTIVVLLAVLVIVAPTLVNLGLGQGLIRGAVQKQIDGEVSFAALKLSWLGEQSVDDLKIVDSSGRTAVDVDLAANRGLLDLIRGVVAPLELRISGSLEGTIDEDGTISFAKLLREDKKGGGASPPRARSTSWSRPR